MGNTVNRMLSAPEKEGYIFEGWKCGNGEYLRLFRPVYEDMTVTASYLAEKGDALTGSIKETEGAADPGSTALAETFVDSESTAVMPDQEAGESVKKEKPFWKRPWFYGALAAAAAFIAAFFIIRGKDRKENWFDEFRDGRG